MAVTIENIDLDMEEEHEEVSSANNEKLADIKKELGNAQFKLKQYGKALPHYSEAIELCPQNASYYGNRSACYLMQGQFTKALEDANQAVAIDAQFVKGWLRIAKCCLAQGNLKGAESAISKARALEPNEPALQAIISSYAELNSLVVRSQIAFAAGEYRLVIYLMDMALKTATSCNQFKVLKAECLVYMGNFVAAQELAGEVLTFDKQNIDAILVRGMCLYYQDNIDKACNHFQHVLKMAPDHPKAMEIYKKAKLFKKKKEEGNEAYKAGKFQEAYNHYTETLAVDPNGSIAHAKIYFNRATVLSKMNRVDESIADCTEALKLDPKYMKALLRRAKSYQDQGKHEEAVADYEKAATTDSKNREVKKLLSEAKLELKKSKRKDYYKILGVSKTASTDEIKKAYRKRAMVHHPDRHTNASESEQKEQEKHFKEIGEAYGILSDPQKKERYDSGVDNDEGDFNFPPTFNFFTSGHEQYMFHFS